MKTRWNPKSPYLHEVRRHDAPKVAPVNTGSDRFLRSSTPVTPLTPSDPPAVGTSALGARGWTKAATPIAPAIDDVALGHQAWPVTSGHGASIDDRVVAHAKPSASFHPELSGESLLDVLRSEFQPKQLRGYDSARGFMFGIVHNEAGHVRCVYTRRDVVTKHVPDADVGARMNTEHTFPKSWMGSKKGAVSDLHHLFPTDTKTNGMRSSYAFGDVVTPTWTSPGDEAKLGLDAHGSTVFEPPAEHKGNVARAMFYVSAIYDIPLEAEQERVLRAWSVADPVDDDERLHNDRIEKVQGNRNPFVDAPALIERIDDF